MPSKNISPTPRVSTVKRWTLRASTMPRNKSSQSVIRNERMTETPPKGLTLFPAEMGRRFNRNVRKLKPLMVFIRMSVRPKDRIRATKYPVR